LLIDLSVSMMLHQMKGIGNGSQDVWHLLSETWKCLHEHNCRNPSLGLATKARACKVAGQEGSLRVTPHAPGSVRKCEGMNLHTPKRASTLGVWVPADSHIFRGRLQGSKLNGLKTSLYHWKALQT
jgi:hypothetical protein